MVNIPKRTAEKFLISAEVENGDVVEIVKEPYIQSAEKSKFGKERTIVTVRFQRNGQVRRWSLNNMSNDALLDAFGADGDLWRGLKVKIQMREENVGGVMKSVLYAKPLVQTKVAPVDASD